MKNDYICPELLAKVNKRQEERKHSFLLVKKKNILDEKASNILKLNTECLLKKLQLREISAKEVLRAYTAKALEVTEKFNCVTEFVPKAKEWAAALDNLALSSTPLPLHGLPFAVKDDTNVEGMDSTLGYAKNLYKPAKESAVFIQILIRLGAIPFCKTNVPQTLFSSGNHNPIYGATLNSVNSKMVPGGSSTGSASLVAADGAVFATGSDVGGSLRIPAHMHGLCTMKPTVNRLSGKGVVQCLPENVAFTGAPGVIAKDANTLSMIWKAMTKDSIQNQFDFAAMPVPWNEEVFCSERKLKIGYFSTEAFFPSFPDTRETLLKAKDYLELRGHELVPFEPFATTNSFEYQKILCNFYYMDQGKYIKNMFEGEPISYCVAGQAHKVRNVGNLERNGREGNDGCNVIWTRTKREKIYSGWGDNVRSNEDLIKLLNVRKAFIEDILKRMKDVGIEAMISPTYPFPALDLEKGSGAMVGGTYINPWNFCDFPAGIVKFGREKGTGIEEFDDEGENMFRMAKLALKESVGMPISVQVISTPFREELVLRLLNELEEGHCDN